MYEITATTTQAIVLQDFMSTVVYALIFGVILGFVWWLFKPH